MQHISIALSALISREHYCLNRASKVAKTDGLRNSVGSEFQTSTHRRCTLSPLPYHVTPSEHFVGTYSNRLNLKKVFKQYYHDNSRSHCLQYDQLKIGHIVQQKDIVGPRDNLIRLRGIAQTQLAAELCTFMRKHLGVPLKSLTC